MKNEAHITIHQYYQRFALAVVLLFITVAKVNCTVTPDSCPKPSDVKGNITGVGSDYSFSADYKINMHNLSLIDASAIRQFSYYPNLRGAITFGARYKIFRLFYTVDVMANQNYNECFGTTGFNDIEFGIKTRLFWLTAYFSRCKGFYYSDESRWYPDFSTDSVYGQNPDLLTFELGFRASIIFNPRYSMEAAFEYSEIQNQSAGAFFLSLNPRYSRISTGETPLIPLSYENYFPELSDFEKVSTLSMGFGLGYGYSIVVGPVNFANAISAGPAFQFSSGHGLRFRIPFDMNARSSLSVNFKNFYTGVGASLGIYNHKFSDEIIRKNILVFTFRVGIRF